MTIPDLNPQATQHDTQTTWQQTFPWEGRRLLDQVTALRQEGAPSQVLAYVSESPEMRAWLRETLRTTCGEACAVRVRSAYKPAYFWVTEELQPLWRRAHADRLTLTYPRLPGENPGRFLQEAYPLAAILEREGVQAEFIPGHAQPTYQATLWRGDTALWQGSCFIPLASRESPDGRTVVAPTGWLTVQADTGPLHDAPLPTDGELFWNWYCSVILPAILDLAGQRNDGLVFKDLSVTLHLSEPDLALDVLDERISMTEALTEEVYFGTLDALKRHTSTPPDARTLTPGRIVPIARSTPGQDGRARVTLTRWDAAPQEREELDLPPSGERLGTSTLLDRPWPPARTWAYARQLADQYGLGWSVPAQSVDGRPVPAMVRKGREGPEGVLVTGGQHANETTGPVAALQFVPSLVASDLNFAVLPLENPDGASLHRALTQIAPEHMHHAARYTSLGDDLGQRQGLPRWETRARAWARDKVNASLHLSLHGYPAHEWVRPYSGYAPYGFESWALPAGFVTILWYWPGQADNARAMADAIARRLLQEVDVTAYTTRAFRTSAAHLLQPHYQLIHGLPFILAEQRGGLCPITVITEAPDETIYGERFQMFVRAHVAVCEAAVAFQVRQHAEA
ncbi:M14 family zinc carboxypeptidase [Deinococcus apachensis]|uniref:M14 family zinc carboxypeptidase n=1 Tax=Deinococcus apachensis TaxID=309886 RepID=UPI00035CD55B|nr:M14 family zinc carboxypeptidase [Deinococcus apachensis]